MSRLGAAATPPEKRHVGGGREALGGFETIRRLIELLTGRYNGAIVCTRWRDASRGLPLTRKEEQTLVQVLVVAHEDLPNSISLSTALRHHDILNIDLRLGVDCSDAAVAALARVCPFLRRVVLDDDAGDEAVVAIAESCPLVTEVDLDGCTNLTGAAISALGKGCRRVTTFRMCDCAIGDDAIIDLAVGCRNLQVVALYGCSCVTDRAVAAIAANCRGLVDINVSSCIITDAALTSLARGCASLTCVDFDNCCEITDSAVVTLSAGCPNLANVNLTSCCFLSDAAVLSLCKHSRRLTRLELCNIGNLTDVSVAAIASSLPNLKELHISSCPGRVSEAAVAALRSARPGARVHFGEMVCSG